VFKEIGVQHDTQKGFFRLFIETILKTFGYSKLPEKCYFLKVSFRSPLNIPAITINSEDAHLGVGLVPLTLQVAGISIAKPPGTTYHSLYIKAKIDDGKDTTSTSEINLSNWEPEVNGAVKVNTATCSYLFTAKALRELLRVLEENATDKNQRREWPKKEEVAHPC